jgi:LPXTG-motif cell wall-anchored protein
LRLITRLLASGAIVNTVSVTGGYEDPTPCGSSCASVEIRSNPVDIELPATGGGGRALTTIAIALLAVGVAMARRSRRRAPG